MRLILALAVCASAANLFGQGAVGTVLGTVTDSSASVVPAASVTITNIETSVSQRTVTSAEGTYNVPYLKPGTYRVTVESKGFSQTTVDEVRLAVDQHVRVDVQLKPGMLSESVTISGEAVALDTETASLGQVVTHKQVAELPLNGRNFTQLLLLSPGAVQTGGEQATRPNSGNAISLMGARPSSNQFLIDGVTNNDTTYQTPAILPSIDAIQEFKEQTKTYSAEYGSSANQINISIKSGTNGLHGSAFEFLRNDFMDARKFFDQGVPVLRQNQFGYTVGGPVYIPKIYNGKNRTFFFANYEGQRTNTAGTAYTFVPTPDQLSGKFDTPIKDPLTGQNFPGNQIPDSRISNFAKILNKYYPGPNANVPQGNLIAVISSPTNADQQTYRGDQNFGSKDSVFGRYSKSSYTSTAGGLITEQNTNNVIDTQSYQVTYTHTFSPSVINQFRWGYLVTEANRLGEPVPQSLLDSFGFKGVYKSVPHTALPSIGVNGFMSPGGAFNVPWLNRQPTYDITNSTTINRGAHTLNFGANIRRWQLQNNTTTGFYGQWNFSGDFTGSSIADYLLGNPLEVWTTQPTPFSDPKNPGAPVRVHYSSFAPYFQDDWKATRRLTINIGLRYDYASLPFEEQNHWSWVDPSIPGGGIAAADKKIIDQGLGAQFYSYGGGRTAGKSQKKVFAPRLGIAYRPFGDNKTVIRTGYGVFFDTAEAFEDIGSGNIYPYTVRSDYRATPGVSLLSTNNLFPDLTTPGPVQKAGLSFYEPQAQRKFNPYVQQWSFSLQRELSSKTKAEISYVGSKGTHLNTRRASNQPYQYDPANPSPPEARLPYPNFGLIVESFWQSNSNYNAMNVKVEHNTSDLSLLAAYTWGRSMDDKSAAAGVDGDAAGWAGPMYTHNQRLDYARSSYDVNQRLVTSVVYNLPFGIGKRFGGHMNQPADLALGGWQVNGIATFQSGFPYSVTAQDVNFYNNTYGQRADVVGNPFPSGFQSSVAQAFNTAAFQNPALGMFGNSGRNVIRGPGINNWDMSLFKNIKFAERVRMQLRLESFNAFNHTQFSPPNAYVVSQGFGVIGNTRAARINQLGAKIIW